MRPTFVFDSSILFEFSKHGLLEEMFRLPIEFVVPDLLFEEELIDLGRYSRDDLLDYGLSVAELGPQEILAAQSHRSDHPSLSLVDSSAIALASGRDFGLLTSDRRMRNYAEELGIAVHEVLWLMGRLLDEGVLAASDILEVLAAMRDDGRSCVPRSQLERRINELSRRHRTDAGDGADVQ